MPPVALVHDYVIGLGGAERVLVSMHRAFPDAILRTAFFRRDQTFPALQDLVARPFATDRSSFLREHHRHALPILPTVFGRATIDADVTICGTSGWSAGVRTTGRKVAYVHAPARWLNDQEAFLSGRAGPERLGLRLLEGRLRRWDQRAMRSADRHLVGSRAMVDVLRALYGVEAEVLPPPVGVDPAGEAAPPAPGLGDGFLFLPARLVTNKNVDVVMDVLRARPDDRLVVAGDGPDEARLRALAPPNTTFLGPVADPGMRWLYQRCRAVVCASHESFGLATAEAAAFGRPAVALRHGGLLDTVVEDETGVFFDTVDAEAIGAAVDRLDGLALPADRLRRHAARWSEAAFVEGLRRVVTEESGRR